MLNYVKPIQDPNTAAYYDPSVHSITFDPDKTVRVDSNGNVDIVYGIVGGHEFTHGVLRELIPGFVYAGETAALDESFADIMGMLTVYYGACYDVSMDFESCLEGIGQPGIMNDPESSDLPATYKGFFFAGSEGCNGSTTCYHTPRTTVPCDNSNNNCDPNHRNATVQSYMFYLLAAGGAGTNDPPLNHPYNVEGIGPFEAAQIAFQTMRVRLSPTSTYPEARDGWIDAAKDLYGANSREVRAVTLAWYAVGIGDVTDVSHNPVDGDQKVPPWPATLEWEDQPDEVEWEVQASTSPSFDQDLQEKQTPVATRPPNGSAYSSVNFNLKPDTNYYWRVHAKLNLSSPGKNGGDLTIVTQPSHGGSPTLQKGWGDWSLVRYFKTDARASTLKSPLGTSPKVYPWGNNEFKWTAVEGGKQYWLDISENKDLGIGSNLGPGHGAQRIVTSEPVGLFRKSSRKPGISGTASGNSSSKNRRTSSSVFIVAKLRGPSNSQKSVQVKDPSGFGSAIIMIGAEFIYGIQRREIDLAGDSLAGLDFQRWLSMHNTLIAAGPDFKRGETSDLASGNVDLAPTILQILGIKSPQKMDGRILSEAMTVAMPSRPPETKTIEATKHFRTGTWRQSLQISRVGSTIYLDEGKGAFVAIEPPPNELQRDR